MDNKHIALRFIKPSQFQITMGLLLGLITVATLVYASFFSSPEVTQYFDYQEKNPSRAYASLQETSGNINQSEFAADASVFVFWSTIGMIGYALVLALIHAAQSGAHLEDELVHAKHRSIVVREAIERLLLRLVGVAMAYGLLVFITKVSVPYMIVSSQAVQNSTAEFLGFLAIAITGSLVVSYFLAIALRIVLLKTHVFKGYSAL